MNKLTIKKGIQGDKIGYIPFQGEPQAARLIVETDRCYIISLRYRGMEFTVDVPKGAVICGDVQLMNEYGRLIKPIGA